MIALLNDPNVSDGTPLSLPPSEDVTHLDLAYQKAGLKRIPVIENLQRQNTEKIGIKSDTILADLWI